MKSTGKRLSFEQVQKKCKINGYNLISKNYVNDTVPLKFKCTKCNKVFSKSVSNIREKSKGYCPECNKPKKGFEDAEKIIQERGGKVIEKETYKNANSKLTIKCTLNHTFKMSRAALVNQKQWCNECARGCGERICRAFFDGFTGKEFKPYVFGEGKSGPDGGMMSLDGLCKDLNIAFEYNGRYHDDPDQKKNDEFKVNLLKEEFKGKVKLIVILDPRSGNKVEEIKKQVKQKLEEYNIPIVNHDPKLDMAKIYSERIVNQRSKLAEAIKASDLIIVGDYIGTKEPIKVQHLVCEGTFSRTPIKLMKFQGCEKCQHTLKLKYDKKVNKLNYEFVELETINRRTMVTLICLHCSSKKIVRSDAIDNLKQHNCKT
jgi:rRNA maturation endonuclease Nob1